MTTVFIVSGTSYTVPADCSLADSVETIGGGGNGSNAAPQNGAGGGGGAYSKSTSLTLSPNASVTIQVGGAAADTWFNGASLGASSVGSKGGGNAAAQVPGAGGASASGIASGIGSAKFSGGNGGVQPNNNAGAGNSGGGAAGPNGAGGIGGTSDDVVGHNGGSGGGGNGGGGAGVTTTSGTGTAGGTAQDGTAGGAGGAPTVDGTAGSHGSGGGGGGQGQGGTQAGKGANGGAGVEWDSTHGSGGGGGGGGSASGGSGSQANSAGGGGLYGGGGGGGGFAAAGSGLGGDGAQGIIVLIYTPDITVGGGARFKQRFNRSPLAYPAGAVPGIDRSHPASPRLVLSCVPADGFALRNLSAGTNVPFTTGAGSTFTNSVDGAVGPYLKISGGGSGQFSFSGSSNTDTGTMAVIGRMVGNTGDSALIVSGSSNIGLWIRNPNGLMFRVAGVSNLFIPPTSGSPYFVAVSWSNNVITNFIARDLSTGILSQTSGVQNTSGNNDNTINILGDSTGEDCSSNIAAIMYSHAVLSMQQLVAWAQVPWSFWYPNQTIQYTTPASAPIITTQYAAFYTPQHDGGVYTQMTGY